jgi:hypothetical protein
MTLQVGEDRMTFEHAEEAAGGGACVLVWDGLTDVPGSARRP